MENNTSSALELVKEVARVCLACLILWVLLAGPAWLAASTRGLTGLSFAILLCMVPGCIAVMVKVLLQLSDVAFFLLASGLRLSFVVGGALIAKTTVGDLAFLEFPLWLLLSYMFVLSVEAVVTLKRMGQLNMVRQEGDAHRDQH